LVMAKLRKFMKGYGANISRELRRRKAELSEEIKKLDDLAEEVGLDNDGWARRYKLEEEVAKFYRQEELYWHSRGRVRWLLEGD
jgi:hypothetical protein